jgi:hypothetical protein
VLCRCHAWIDANHVPSELFFYHVDVIATIAVSMAAIVSSI